VVSEQKNFPNRKTTSDDPWAIVGRLISGILIYGGLGWLIGSWFNKVEMFVAAGSILGIGLALYMTYKQLNMKK
jgi:F0F1-type ATP synthase assembly protein I